MQTSQVFNQAQWPKAGDVDDCGYVSAQQLVNTVAPWLPLYDVPYIRAKANDPDDGHTDGASQTEVLRACRGIAPTLADRFRLLEARPIAELQAAMHEGRPASVAVISSRLPPGLRFGFAGSHRVTIVLGVDELLIANPLAPVYSAWVRTGWLALRPAMEAHAGAGKVDAVVGPTEDEALAAHPLLRRATATARAQGFLKARDAAAKVAGDAAAAIGRLTL